MGVRGDKGRKGERRLEEERDRKTEERKGKGREDRRAEERSGAKRSCLASGFLYWINTNENNTVCRI